MYNYITSFELLILTIILTCCFFDIQNFGEMMKYYASLEAVAFTADVDSRILEVFQQFQTLL